MRKPFALLLALLAPLFALPGARAAGVPPESFQDLRWRLLGPLRAGWSICAEGVPGEIDTFYFCGADGGVWKTTDSGTTWQPISDSAPFSSVGALAVAESGGKRILYVGTGQVQTRYDVMDGTGVYKSEDDGKTWTSLGLRDTLHIGRIWVDPRDPGVLVVAALGHVYGPNAERGVFRSADGGKTWTKAAFVDEETGACELAADPAAPDVLYAAFWQVRRYPWQGYHQAQTGPGSGIWRSNDGGKTWSPSGRKGLPEVPLGRIGLAVAPGTKGTRVYAAIDAAKGGGVYRSDDGGASWTQTSTDRSIAGSYMGRIFPDTRNPDVVYAMGQSFRRSDDGGKTFRFVKGSPGGDDYHFLWINPKRPERMVLASDQGTTVTVNGGETWTPWYNQATGQFYRLGVDDQFPYRVYSGQQDNGTVSVASRSSYGQLTFRDWNPVGGDERDGDLPDPEDPTFVFGSGLGGKLTRWDARTGRVANVSPWPISSYGQNPAKAKYRTTWITPIAFSPRPPHPLYWGTQFLFRSLDKGQSWEKVSPDLTGADPALAGAATCGGDLPIERTTACGYGVIFAVAPSPVADGVIWVGTDNGRISLSRDGARTWVEVTPKGLADWGQVGAIDASPTDPAIAYAAVDRHRLDDREPQIWITHDYGATWRRSGTGIPSGTYVTVVRQDPVRPGLLYAGTRNGVFVSFDDGGAWQPLQLNLPRTAVNDLLVKDRDLVIATQGRALWILDDVTPLRYAGAAAPRLGLAPPAPAYRVAANENRDTPLPPEFPTTPNPPAGAMLDYFLPTDLQGALRIEIVDGAGEVVRAFASDEARRRPEARQYFHDRWLLPLPVPTTRPGHNRFAWDLRYPQPEATDYDFSIGAIPGRDTPTLPQGPFVLPGTYKVRIAAGGVTVEQPLEVRADPRAPVPAQALADQLALEKEVIRTLAGTVEAIRAATLLRAQLGSIADDPSHRLAVEAAKARDTLNPLLGGGGPTDLAQAGGVLTNLETDLEAADGPPTAVQRELYGEMKAKAEAGLKRWGEIRSALGRELAEAAQRRKVALLPGEGDGIAVSRNEDEP